MSKKMSFHISESGIHIGSKVKLDEAEIIRNQRGKYLDLYRLDCQNHVVSHIVIHSYDWMPELDVQYLVGDHFFEKSELILEERQP